MPFRACPPELRTRPGAGPVSASGFHPVVPAHRSLEDSAPPSTARHDERDL